MIVPSLPIECTNLFHLSIFYKYQSGIKKIWYNHCTKDGGVFQKLFLLFLMMFLTLSTSEAKSSDLLSKEDKVYYFGFDLRNSITSEVPKYKPFLEYLHKSTGYTFKLYLTPIGTSATQMLLKNKIQFAAIGAMGYLKGKDQLIPIVRGLNQDNKSTYHSMLITKPDSPISSINEIAGNSISFGSETSTQGYLIPRIMFEKYHISLDDFSSYRFSYSHQKCAQAVIRREADICALQDTLATQLAGKNLVKIIHTSEPYPSSGIVANKTVPVSVINKVRQALIDFDPQGKDKQGLLNWEKTEMPHGFEAAHEEDYLPLYKWVKHFKLLEN